MPERFLLDSSAFIAFHTEFATMPAPLKQEMLPPKKGFNYSGIPFLGAYKKESILLTETHS